ncbi:MAG: hypothetical protein WCZ28_15645 [Burkholderiaceae bacterium]
MNRTRSHAPWYRQPLFWLGSFILIASLAGCVWMIVMAARYPDPPLDTGSQQMFRMPLDGATAPASSR